MSQNLTRRTLMAHGLGLLGASASLNLLNPLSATAAQAPGYTLPPLAFPFAALEPHIDAKTMEIHHDKHHQTYITNLNTALKDHPKLQGMPIEKLIADLSAIPEAIRTVVRNNGGGHYNHSLFWTLLSPNGGGEPKGDVAKAITSDLGGLTAFKEAFGKAATTRFGSGWAWLVIGKDGKLTITSTANQDSPISEGIKPILALDVWEHAYYLKYQNRRADYITAFWNVVNWAEVEKLYHTAKG